MALPYSPRTTWDVTVNLNTNDVRTYEGATYSGQHVRVIPKTTIDTAKGLVFNGCASVTIIGGHFRPSTLGNYGSGSIAPGTFTFNTVGNVYLEGVVIDNINIFTPNIAGSNGGDAIFCTAKTALTTFTAQNCHFTNVRGLESNADAHGDIFQTGSNDMGKCGPVRFHNCTLSGNYQGIFTDPQTGGIGGGITSLTLSRVNLFRTENVAGPRLLFFYSNETDYNATLGYSISLTDVWAQGSGTQTITDVIWPSNVAGSANQFPTTKIRATVGTDSVGTFAQWPNAQDEGRAITGRVYQGKPAAGDFAPIARIGINNYVQGTELDAPAGPAADPWIAQPDGNLLLPQDWVTSGAVTIDGTTGAIAITATGTRCEAVQTVQTQVGQPYRLTYHINTSDQIASPIGTAPGQFNIIPDGLRTPAPGDISLNFTATTTQAAVHFSRTSTAAPSASSIILEKMPVGSTLARRLDGRSQYFRIDAAAAGLRTANYNWAIGGWVKWTYEPISTVYIADFGEPAPAATGGGAARNRIAYDVSQTKLFCSSSALDGTSYREVGHTVSIQRDVWYHIVMVCQPNADIQLYLNGVAVGTTTGTITPPIETAVCRTLTIGARSTTTPTNFNPARYADWFWHSNALPTSAQLRSLGTRGTRPNGVTGFSPTFWWAFDGTDTAEESKSGLATLSVVNQPASVLGPIVGVTTPTDPDPEPVVSSFPLDFIIF